MPVKRKLTKQKRKSSTVNRRRKSKFQKVLAKKLRSFFLAVLSVGFATLLGIGYGAYKFINAPFSDASGLTEVSGDSVWLGEQATLLALLVSDIDNPYADVLKLKIVNLDNLTKKYQIYEVPVDVDIPYALNYGSGPLERLYSLGNADQNRGMYAIEQTLFQQLGVHIDGYVVMDNDGVTKIENKLGEINKDDLAASLRLRNVPSLPSAISLVRTEGLTNMKISDVLSIVQFFHGTSSTSSNYKQLNKYHLIDSNNWDTLWQSRSDASAVNKENIKVFVANDSSDPKIPGLASWGARVVKNIGADVLETDNSYVEFDEDTIITEDPELETVKELAHIFDIKNIVLVDNLDKSYGYNPEIFRAKVSLILKSY